MAEWRPPPLHEMTNTLTAAADKSALPSLAQEHRRLKEVSLPLHCPFGAHFARSVPSKMTRTTSPPTAWAHAVLQRSSKRLKALFTADPHAAASALPLLNELHLGFFDLQKHVYSTAYHAFMAEATPPTSPATSPSVEARLAAKRPRPANSRTHPSVSILLDESESSSDDGDDSEENP